MSALSLADLPRTQSVWRVELTGAVSMATVVENIKTGAIGKELEPHVWLVTLGETTIHVHVASSLAPETLLAFMGRLRAVTHDSLLHIKAQARVNRLAGQGYEALNVTILPEKRDPRLLLEMGVVYPDGNMLEPDETWLTRYICRTRLALEENWQSAACRGWLGRMKHDHPTLPWPTKSDIVIDLDAEDAMDLDAPPPPPAPGETLHCPFCSATAVGLTALEAHVEAAHGDMGAFACLYCDKRFDSDAAVSAHTAVQHPAHVCQTCGHRFPSADVFIEHQREKSHGAYYSPLTCIDCQLHFASAAEIAAHYVAEGHGGRAGPPTTPAAFYGSQWLCRDCSQSFGDMPSLHSHQQVAGHGVWALPDSSRVPLWPGVSKEALLLPPGAKVASAGAAGELGWPGAAKGWIATTPEDADMVAALAASRTTYEAEIKARTRNAREQLWHDLEPGLPVPQPGAEEGAADECSKCGHEFRHNFSDAWQALPCYHAAYCRGCYELACQRGDAYAHNCFKCGKHRGLVQYRPHPVPDRCLVCRSTFSDEGVGTWTTSACGCLVACSRACLEKLSWPMPYLCPVCLEAGPDEKVQYTQLLDE